jgi:D-cysteine desulfhydrase
MNTACVTENQRPLASYLPKLWQKLPPLNLTRLPTPVERLRGLGVKLGREDLWIKRDDLTSALYGGNKPRKLEFLLGQARRQGRNWLITMGGFGSNHLLATVLHGRSLGLGTTGVIFPQPISAHVLRNLAACRAAGAELVPIASKYLLPLAVARTLTETALRRGRRPYLIAGGGSSPLGVLGYINAALELAEQVASGVLPRPREIFLPWGTGGTVVGLWLGLRLAGLKCRVRAVRVIDPLLANRPRLELLARAVRRLMGSAGDNLKLSTDAGLIIEGAYLGGGYGVATEASRRAIETFAAEEKLQLENTYTGKAAAAFLEAARRGEKGPLLYWHTLSSADISSWVDAGLRLEQK